MTFAINVRTEMRNRQEAIDISFLGLPFPVKSVPAKDLPFKGAIEVPSGPWWLVLEIHFRASGEIVHTAAFIDGAHGLDIEQQGPDFVLAQIRHSAHSSQEQCTVTCLTTGESRSGRGQCVECRLKRGVVKLCC